MVKKSDAGMAEFEAALLRSAKQAIDGQYARVYKPDEIVSRPVGSAVAVRQPSTTIRLDEEILAAFKATGQGWQTRMNNALRDWLKANQLI